MYFISLFDLFSFSRLRKGAVYIGVYTTDNLLNKDWLRSLSSTHCRGKPFTHAGRIIKLQGSEFVAFIVLYFPASLLLHSGKQAGFLMHIRWNGILLYNPDLSGPYGWRDEEKQKRQRRIQTVRESLLKWETERTLY